MEYGASCADVPWNRAALTNILKKSKYLATTPELLFIPFEALRLVQTLSSPSTPSILTFPDSGVGVGIGTIR
jgi:hypothetical protein